MTPASVMLKTVHVVFLNLHKKLCKGEKTINAAKNGERGSLYNHLAGMKTGVVPMDISMAVPQKPNSKTTT